MAALTLAAGVACGLSGSTPAVRAGDEPAVVNKIRLEFRITGLAAGGCEIDVKPGHAACGFAPIHKRIDQRGALVLDGVEVKSTSPDRDCLFEVTVKEPGQPSRTVRRGIRLTASAPGQPVPQQEFKCLLRSPSLIARDDAAKRVR